MNNTTTNKIAAPPGTPARLAAAAEASGIARMGKLRAALAAALRGALSSTDYEVKKRGEEEMEEEKEMKKMRIGNSTMARRRKTEKRRKKEAKRPF